MTKHARRLPPPTRVLCVNAMSVSAGPAKAIEIFRAATNLRPALILATECADFNAERVAGKGWSVVQYGQQRGDEDRAALAGCVIAVRDEVAHLHEGTERLLLGSRATREGRWKTGHGIRSRYIIKACVTFHPGTPRARTRWVAVGHSPPARAPIARAAFMLRLARTRAGIKAGDLNLRHDAVVKALGAFVRSVGVLHVIVAPWQPVGRAKPVDLGGDHQAVSVMLWPRKKETP